MSLIFKILSKLSTRSLLAVVDRGYQLDEKIEKCTI